MQTAKPKFGVLSCLCCPMVWSLAVAPGELPKSHSSSGDEGGGGHQTPGNSAQMAGEP